MNAKALFRALFRCLSDHPSVIIFELLSGDIEPLQHPGTSFRKLGLGAAELGPVSETPVHPVEFGTDFGEADVIRENNCSHFCLLGKIRV